MNGNELITSVFSKLGVTLPAEIQTELGKSLSNIKVSDEVANKINVDYFTKESALQNPAIRNAIKAETLNGIDSQTKELIAKYGLDAEGEEILKEDKTSKRLEKLAEKLVEATKAKSKANGADKDVLTKKIEELNADILKVKAESETLLNSEKQARKLDKINWELDSIYNGLDYSLQADKNINVTAAKAIIEKIAGQKGIKFETTEQGIVMHTKEGTDYFENNVKVNPSDFIKKTLIESKMIKVSDNKQNQQQHQTQPARLNMPQQPNMSSFNSAIDSLMGTQQQ